MSSSSVKEKFQVSPFLCFSDQCQSSWCWYFKFQTNLVRTINNDGWIAILIAGASVNLMIFLIYFCLKKHLLTNLVILRNLCLVNGLDNSSTFSTFYIFLHCLWLCLFIIWMWSMFGCLKKFLVFYLHQCCSSSSITFTQADLEQSLAGHSLALS